MIDTFVQYLDTFGNFILLALGFSLVIFIHEFGHFIVAKRVGIRVDQFAIGFGQAALAWRKGLGLRIGTTTPEYEKRLANGAEPASMSETEYRLNWFPLGGYVKMLGQDDLEQGQTSNDPRSYSSKSIGARMAVLSAGVILNVVSAFIFFVGCFMWGIYFPAPVVGQVADNSPAANAIALNASEHGITTTGLQPGDWVREVEGRKTRRFADLQLAAVMSKPDKPIMFVVDRDGVELEFLVQAVKNNAVGRMTIGIAPALSLKIIDPEILGPDQADLLISEMARWGMSGTELKPGMVLRAVNGNAIKHYWELAKFTRTIKNNFELELEFHDPENPNAPAVRTTARVVPEFMDQLTYSENLLGFMPLVQVGGFVNPPQSNALRAEMKIGDIIAKINDLHWPTPQKLVKTIKAHAGENVDFIVLRQGERIPLTVAVSRKGAIGIRIAHALDEMRVNTIATTRVLPITNEPTENNAPDATAEPAPEENADPTPTVPAIPARAVWAAAQIFPPLPAGSKIISINNQPIADWREFKAVLTAETKKTNEDPAETVTVKLGVELTLPGNPREIVDWAIPAAQVAELHELGWSLEPRFFTLEETLLQSSNPLQAISYGLEETSRMLTMTYLTIDRVFFQRTVDAKNIKGPIGIAHIGTEVASQGLPKLIMFLAIISVNLAVLNFLPIPILDGGQFLFLIIEKLKGSPVSPALQDLATLGGLIILGGLFIFVTFNDISNLISGNL